MTKELTVKQIQNYIVNLPSRPPFMLTQHLAEIYKTEAKYINRAVERNKKRFPEDFCFQLTLKEIEIIKKNWCQIGTNFYAGAKKRPYDFTREGANMLSAVLHTDLVIFNHFISKNFSRSINHLHRICSH